MQPPADSLPLERIEELVRLGFLSRAGPDSDSFQVHPVLRQYLRHEQSSGDAELRRTRQLALQALYFDKIDSEGKTPTGLRPAIAAMRHALAAGETGGATGLYDDFATIPDTHFKLEEETPNWLFKRPAFGWMLELEALDVFFQMPWTVCVEGLPQSTQNRLRSQAAFALMAQGRPDDALAPLEENLRNDEPDRLLRILRAWLAGELQLATRLANRKFQEEALKVDVIRDELLRFQGRKSRYERTFQAGEVLRGRQRPQSVGKSILNCILMDSWLHDGWAREISDACHAMLSLAQSSGSTLLESHVFLRLGRAHRALHEFESSREWLAKARIGFEEVQRVDHVSSVLVDEGLTFRELAQFDQALESFEEALSLSEPGGMRLHQIDALLGIASIHRIQGRRRQADKLDREARTMIEETGYHASVQDPPSQAAKATTKRKAPSKTKKRPRRR